MKTKHRFFFFVLFILMSGPLVSTGFCAERYPDRPIQFIVSQVEEARLVFWAK